jgi:hypothetical protein
MQFLPPSCRFPPLREGNRAEVRFPLPTGFPYCLRGTRKAVPPACRGNLKEGVRNFAYFRTPSGVKGESGVFRGNRGVFLTRLLQVGGSVFSRHCRS